MPKMMVDEHDPLNWYLETLPVQEWRSIYGEIDLTDDELAEYQSVVDRFEDMQKLIERKMAERDGKGE